MRMCMQFRLGCRLPCLWLEKRSETSVKIIKNEVRCRDDTVPKTIDTRKHCKVGLRACNNLPQPPPFGVAACSQPYLAVLSCIYSFWHGVIPTSYFIFNDFYTCIIPALSSVVKKSMVKGNAMGQSTLLSDWKTVVHTSTTPTLSNTL